MNTMCSCATLHGCVRPSVFGPFVFVDSESGPKVLANLSASRGTGVGSLDQSQRPAELLNHYHHHSYRSEIKASTTTNPKESFVANNPAQIAVSAAFMISQSGRLRPSSLATSPDPPHSAEIAVHAQLDLRKRRTQATLQVIRSQGRLLDHTVSACKANDCLCSPAPSHANGHGRCHEFFETFSVTHKGRQDTSNPIIRPTTAASCKPAAFPLPQRL